jgi:DNA-binding LacI/PurR family transcriptional regulator
MDKKEDLESYLESMARSAAPGDRLPTVRTLMTRFGVSQGVVQKAMSALKQRGLISAEVGRGTFFVGAAETATGPGPAAEARAPSVLLLRRATSLQRGKRVLELLQARFQSDGWRVVEMSYTDHRDALAILRTLPKFDCCVVQSTFETISIEMLVALQRKTRSIVIDGAALSGTEADAVGLEWGTSVGLAVARLERLGHGAIGLVTTAHFLLASELGRRRFLGAGSDAGRRSIVEIPAWPHQDYERLAVDRIAALRRADGSFPFSALIVWGIESGQLFRKLLADRGIAVPGDLSVVLLGRTDLMSEHDGFFDCIGSSTARQAEKLYEAVQRRRNDADAEYRTFYLDCETRDGRSTDAPSTAEPPSAMQD